MPEDGEEEETVQNCSLCTRKKRPGCLSHCCHCGEKFKTKGKGYCRVKLHSRLSDLASSSADVLQEYFGIQLEPAHQEDRFFVCITCANILKRVKDATAKFLQAKTKFLARTSSHSYIGEKITASSTSSVDEPGTSDSIQETPQAMPVRDPKSRWQQRHQQSVKVSESNSALLISRLS